jgi:hypothetical protein
LKIVAFLVLAIFMAGVIYLFGVEFAAGDVYPKYSSLRTDPEGARLLYDSLAQVPGIQVERSFVPLNSLHVEGATVLLLDYDPVALGSDRSQSRLIEALAKRGNRVVVTMAPPPKGEAPKSVELQKQWGVEIRFDNGTKHVHRRLYFAQWRLWTKLDQVGDKLFALEHSFGNGTVLLLADSSDFSNESAVAGDRFEKISKMLGDSKRIVFDESHLGIVESGSFVGLARRFRLTGFAAGLAICAALFVWRKAAGFPPPNELAAESFSGRTSASGLLTLLKKHVPPGSLAEACWQEWHSANRRKLPDERLKEAAAIVSEHGRTPLEAVRRLQSVVRAKGSL